MTEWRLKAYRHWLKMEEPRWAHVEYDPVDYQAISYYAAPKSKKDAPKSLDEVDPKLLETYDKLGVPLHERAKLAGRGRRRRLRQRLGGHDLQGEAQRGRASSSAPSPRRFGTTRSS